MAFELRNNTSAVVHQIEALQKVLEELNGKVWVTLGLNLVISRSNLIVSPNTTTWLMLSNSSVNRLSPVGKVVNLDDYRDDTPEEIYRRVDQIKKTTTAIWVNPLSTGDEKVYAMRLEDLRTHLVNRWLVALRAYHEEKQRAKTAGSVGA